MGWFLDTAAVTAAVGLVAGFAVPTLIGRIPEPESVDETLDDVDAATGPEAVAGSVVGMVATTPEAPKELSLTIARLPGLRWKAAVASALVAGLLGARIGWHAELLPLLYLSPVGVALAVVD